MSLELPNEVKPAFIRTETRSQSAQIENPIKTAASPKKRSQSEESADALFSVSYIPDDPGQLSEVVDLIEKHADILSITRPGTKTLENTFLKMRQLVNSEFLYAYTWDRAWFNRVSKYCPVENLKFTWESLVARLDDVLGYVSERQAFGYWWPSKKNGKARKQSLSDFIACPMKSKNWWSPFLEIACGECITPRMLRSTLGDKVCQILDEILKDVWFSKDFKTMVNFYKSVSSLKEWHAEASRGMTGEANYHVSSFTHLLERIKQCNLETHCIGPNFIGPWSNKWSVLKSWFKRVHGVEL